MSSIHVYLGIALLASNAVAAIWGVLVWRGTLAAGRAFAQVLALSHTLAFGEAVLGLSLLGDRDETEGLHEIYGFLPAGIVLAAYTMRTDDQKRNVLIFAVAAAAITGLTIRAATTGG